MASSLQLVITTPDDTVFEGEVERVMAPGPQGEIAILPDHTPFYTQLAKGDIEIYAQGDIEKIPIDGGIIRASQNQVTVIVGFDEDTDTKQK